MWTVLGSREVACDQVSRRKLLQVGVLAGAGLTTVNFLRAKSQAATAGLKPPRSAIHVFLGGGPSHFETFDPKPEAPAEIRGPYQPINTSVPGVYFSEWVPKLAEIADKCSIIRSCCHDNPGHGGGQRYVTTGYKSASLEGELPHDYPNVGAVISKVRGPMRNGMPTFMAMGTDADAAYLGPAFGPFKVYSTGKPIGLEVNASVKLERLADRRGLRKQLDNFKRDSEVRRVMDSLDALEQQAYEMLTSTVAHDAFNLKLESETTRNRYGDHDAGRSCLLARRFVEAGAGYVTVRQGSWDHHGNAGGTITTGMQANCPQMDQSVSALIADLHERGLSDQVVVYLWGEFGRTPRINSFFGRDHWPQAMSVLVAGGGLKMGRVIGATNRKGEYPVDRALSPGDVLSTIYRQLGVDTHLAHLNTAGRPIPILTEGSPIPELI